MVCNKILKLMKGTTLFIPLAWSVQNVINSTTLKLSFISIKIYAKRQLTAGHISSPPHRHTMQLIPLYSQHIFLVYPGACPWGKLMRYVLQSMKIYEAVGDPQGGPAPYFQTKLRPEGLRKCFWETTHPALSKGLDDCPPPTLSQGLHLAPFPLKVTFVVNV